ncbi:MAG: hypothetical protein AD073_000027 [Mycoplasmataceae bacterium]|nr:MAG: hypothetical protein AD073_000027 [Mycoplasmataceae bacterium]
MQRNSINVYFNKQDYETIKNFIPKGMISSLASSLIIDYIQNEKKRIAQEAIEGYQFYKKDNDFKKLSSQFEPVSFNDVCTALEKKDNE